MEIKEPYFAHGLDPIVRRNDFKLCGILNGIDDTGYNPQFDTHIFANYTPDDMSNKAVNKAELQKNAQSSRQGRNTRNLYDFEAGFA